MTNIATIGGITMQSRTIIAAGLALLLFMALSQGPGHAAEKKEIRIGVLLPQTGYISHFGLMQEAALKMVEKEIKEKGGIGDLKVRFVVYDTACKPKDA